MVGHELAWSAVRRPLRLLGNGGGALDPAVVLRSALQAPAAGSVGAEAAVAASELSGGNSPLLVGDRAVVRKPGAARKEMLWEYLQLLPRLHRPRR